MRFIMILIVGSVFAGMTALALANPSMLPKHPGYPASGEFANDTGRTNLTYRQSMEEAARSGDIAMPIHPKNTELLNAQVGDPGNEPAEKPGKDGVRIPKTRQ